MVERIGFAGLGLMGGRMALNLIRKGFPLTVWNRTPGRCEPLARAGARLAGSPRELAESADVVVACLADPPAVERLVFAEDGLLAGAGRMPWRRRSPARRTAPRTPRCCS
jgi:3-hydroxyisobutyrate dehydrogenase-like beta-hydroxyacid dehydrogenase